MVSPVKNNEISKWRNNNICGSFHETTFDDFQVIDMKKYFESIEKEVVDTKEGELFTYDMTDLNAACPSGTKPCGRLSQPEMFACFAINNPCPINSIVIDQNASPPDDTYVSLFFGDGFFLHYSKDKFQNYLVSGDFRITGEKVCMNPFERIGGFDNNQSNGGIVEDCTTKIGGRLEDHVIVQLDSVLKTDLLKDNELTTLYSKNQIYSKAMENEEPEMFLYSKPFMYFDKDCSDEELTNAELINERKYINNRFNTVALVLLIFSAIGKCYLIIII